ncbi:MAG: hypothetical protein QOH91_4172, partial [Mycobacterium sp.]|nr:hypothetical protein [Mycobacterium sp.]
GLDFDDDGAHVPAGEGGAEQSMRGRDWVDHQVIGAHRNYLTTPDRAVSPPAGKLLFQIGDAFLGVVVIRQQIVHGDSFPRLPRA